MNQGTILVINCGSSSIKFSLFGQQSGQRLLEGLAERLGNADGQLHWHTPTDSGTEALGAGGHRQAMAAITRLLAPLLDAGVRLIGIGHLHIEQANFQWL